MPRRLPRPAVNAYHVNTRIYNTMFSFSVDPLIATSLHSVSLSFYFRLSTFVSSSVNCTFFTLTF